MSPKEAARAFAKAQQAELRKYVGLLRDADAEIRRLVEAALVKVRSQLADMPADADAGWLAAREREISQALNALRAQAQGVATTFSTRAWLLGIAAVDVPLAAGGLSINGIVPQISTRQLDAIRSFMTDRIKDATAEAINKMNTQLGLTLIGAQTPSQAVTAITDILQTGTRQRALTIVNDNLGRAYSVASHERMKAAAKTVEMDKVWRRSGKRHQRIGHALADGQRRAVNEPFEVVDKDGVIVKLMFPRDPAAPLGETINCGCVSIPKVRGWNTATPDRAPFRADELDTNPQLRAVLARIDRKA
jgi:hypothetical protein